MEPELIERPIDYYERYSRQRYVLGEMAMRKMERSRVLISGLGGVGVEIAKNVALAGVYELTLHDTIPSTWRDLSTQYYLDGKSLGTNRALASLHQISQLNPYVKYCLETSWNPASGDLGFLDEFTCVVLTEQSLMVQKRLGDYCHLKNISFIAADSYGAFAYAFNDAGPMHEVFDTNGEPCKQAFIEQIQLGVETTINCVEEHKNDFEEGDCIKITQVNGTEELNFLEKIQNVYRISRVVFPRQLVISVDSSSFRPYTGGGIITEVKMPKFIHFKSLSESLAQPEFAFTDFDPNIPASLHVGFQALHEFVNRMGDLPRPWNVDDSNAMLTLAHEINSTTIKIELNELLIKKLSWSSRGKIIGVTAFIGGVVAQEVIKVISGKFSPLKQFIYFSASEILEDLESDGFDGSKYKVHGLEGRYDAQILLLGNEVNDRVLNMQTFVVGSGAIGCEIMKDIAMLGVSAGDFGRITITDNDLIEKSNLNRQFLFRENDIKKPKSVVASKAAKVINPDLQVEAFFDKVGPDSENVYTDSFFQTLDVVINALDNVEARLYIDSRCIDNCRPLLESGTLGTKGHVQVILPHLTESYGSQADPKEESYPLCTIKSFPSLIEHTIQWARSKFESIFVEKPQQLLNFLKNPKEFLQNGSGQTPPNGNVIKYFVKVLMSPFKSFEDCVKYARLKFHSYYYLSIEGLLHMFPLDALSKDGSSFWKAPKKPPRSLTFDLDRPYDYDFLVSTALLLCEVYGVPVPENATEIGNIRRIVDKIVFPEFCSNDKKYVELTENATTPAPNKLEHYDKMISQLRELVENEDYPSDLQFKISPITFEKDNDQNHHIDFITACSNLRAVNYKIEPVDKFETKRIACKIIPAIATTTAAVAALVSLELVKIAKKCPMKDFKNYYLNLALSYYQSSEPAEAQKNYLSNGTYYTIWDKWIVNEGDILLERFNKIFADKYELNVTAIIQNTYTVYMNLIPSHKARMKKRLSSLLKEVESNKNYVDLVVVFEDFSGKSVNCPDVRFYWR